MGKQKQEKSLFSNDLGTFTRLMGTGLAASDWSLIEWLSASSDRTFSEAAQCPQEARNAHQINEVVLVGVTFCDSKTFVFILKLDETIAHEIPGGRRP